MSRYRFAMLGAGKIAQKIGRTISYMNDEIIPYAVGSRDLERAEKTARKFGFEKAYGSYEEMLSDENVDIVYVNTPHSHHLEHTKLCLEHGKHVLCEKSFAANASQAEEMVALAKEKNLFLGEAVWTRFMPFIQSAKEIIDKGRIGSPNSLEVGFGQNLTAIDRLSDPNLCGGSLLDLGIYPLTFADIFFGDSIESILSQAVMYKDVEGACSISIKYTDGKIASLRSSIMSTMPNFAVISGNEGYIIFRDFWQCESFEVFPREKTSYVVNCPFEINGYEYEIRAAIKALDQRENYCPEMTWDKTIHMMRLMDSFRKDWGIVFPCE